MPIISYEDMKEKKRKILNALIDIAGVVDELNVFGLAINGEALLDLKNKLESDNFKVLVIGEFKNGKSTFINSLMGKKFFLPIQLLVQRLLMRWFMVKQNEQCCILKIHCQRKCLLILNQEQCNILRNMKEKRFRRCS